MLNSRRDNNTDTKQILLPGSIIGVFGGGQLGRMIGQAAQQLGYRFHVFSPEPEAPACQITSYNTIGSFDDHNLIARFVDQTDLVTLEFENIPLETAEIAQAAGKLAPNSHALSICQDRIQEKLFVAECGGKHVPFKKIETPAQVHKLQLLWNHIVLKTSRDGYDGKGQLAVTPTTTPEVINAFLEKHNNTCIIAEKCIDIAMEISCIVARRHDGETSVFPLTENKHEGGVLRSSTVPAQISQDVGQAITNIALTLAQALNIAGLLTTEFFIDHSGNVFVNELAPRPHNSGHWTLDASETSQFEQLVRAICGLPLGGSGFRPASMYNLIGEEVNAFQDIAGYEHTKIHHYGKSSIRAGRKMGHYTKLEI